MKDLRRDRRYSSPAWRVLRRQVLERDGFVCQLRLPGCERIATQVDHNIEPSLGGAFFDVWNLRAACGHCNLARRNQRRAAAARRQYGEE